MNEISFIIPNRGGTHLEFITKKINDIFGNHYNCSIYIITQADNKPFMRGQLLNIGYLLSDGEYLCFIDNDIFFEKFIDLPKILQDKKIQCVQPFDTIKQVKLSTNGYTQLSVAPKNKYGKGGVTFITREYFEKINGFSNLFIGYGNEDTDFDYRCNGLLTLPITICHIKHDRRNNDWHWDVNKQIRQHYKEIDTNLDSFKQLKYNIISDNIIDNVRYINVNDITVCDEYKYNDFLKLHNDKHFTFS